MFEDDDEEDYDFDFKESRLEIWYRNNYGYIRRESNPDISMLDVPLEVSLFYSGVYSPAMKEIAPAVRRLMLKQYPIIVRECRPLVLKYIDDTVNYAGHQMLMFLWQLVQDQKEGINLREKYPDLDSWTDFYARPPKAPEPDYSFFDKYPVIGINMNEEQKKEYIEADWTEEAFYFQQNERFKKEYYDIVQPVVLKYFKALEDLNYEGWIIYAVEIREDYEMYKSGCYHLCNFIEYEFEEEDINLNYKDYMEKLCLKSDEKRKKEQLSKDSNAS